MLSLKYYGHISRKIKVNKLLFTEDATYYAEEVKKQSITIVELVQHALTNIQALNPELNAVTHIQRDHALAMARDYDTHLASLEAEEIKNLPAFFGVPILLKDLGQSQAGQASNSGAQLLSGYQSKVTDNFVQKVLDAGFIVVGRTNVPEFGFKNISDSKLNGRANAPFDLKRNPGGSSGGAASALKAGIVPIVTASDGGGSIRIPASFSGLIGLKPSRGRMPVGPGSYRGWQGASIHFALTKSIRDSWSLLKAMQVQQNEAPFIMPRIEEKELKPLEKALRIAYSLKSPINQPLTEEASEALHHTIKILKDLGHHLIEDQPSVDGIEAMKSYYKVNAVETALMMDDFERALKRPLDPKDMEIMSWAIYRAGLKLSGIDYAKVLSYWDQLTADSEAFFQDYDILLMPASNGPAPLHSEFLLSDEFIEQLSQIDALESEEQLELIWQMFAKSLAWTPFTQQMNLTGQPAISLPLYQTESGLPIGSQFSSPKASEYLLLQLGQQLEQAGHLKISTN